MSSGSVLATDAASVVSAEARTQIRVACQSDRDMLRVTASVVSDQVVKCELSVSNLAFALLTTSRRNLLSARCHVNGSYVADQRRPGERSSATVMYMAATCQIADSSTKGKTNHQGLKTT